MGDRRDTTVISDAIIHFGGFFAEPGSRDGIAKENDARVKRRSAGQ